ncbi:PQQ-dependent sugar dehydrogenase [Sphingomonas sp. R-74633]|uniref:PQQ-dependent sugar dehydrogenase n=1 Tax=Sphingomonas sp. R-74633 TaxID=2751188 RepID=UPI0015D3FE79|nr:PQQ-dependent sugar dehydrogenase [Sphingomonas sp. R-74633]NYT39479.1 PQQ-dependent sugar dehydrogenase [Sphingomonas sp. R-74633]
MTILRAGAGKCAIAIATLGLALSGCSGGGGGGGSTPTPTPTNHAPGITSAATFSVVENSTAAVYQASATDSDGDAVTLSLSGTDAARFTISATGDVRFAATPNFEKPADADADNVYNLQLSASDGKTSVSQAVTVTVTNSKEGIAVQDIAFGFDHPVAITSIPGDSRLMIAERSGAIYIYDPAVQQHVLFAKVPNLTNADGQGILSVAPAPDFATRPIVYTLIGNGTWIELQRIGGASKAFIGYHNLYTNNVGGWAGFGADGLLYVATGDAGGTNDPSGSAQSGPENFFSALLGKLMSFAPADFDAWERAQGGAAVPPAIVPRAVLAKGLHYPIGGSFYAGGLLLPDRGQSVREEVNALTLTAGATDNLGWPWREGTSVNLAGEPAGLLAPVLDYPHGTGTYAGQQIMSGLVYQGANASLAGSYLFLDASGAVFTAPVASLQRGSTAGASAMERRDLDFTPSNGTIVQPVSMTQTASGAIYIICDNGHIFRVTAS